MAQNNLAGGPTQTGMIKAPLTGNGGLYRALDGFNASLGHSAMACNGMGPNAVCQVGTSQWAGAALADTELLRSGGLFGIGAIARRRRRRG
ncbi:MAG: hypothetical protein ACT4P7_07350 [Gemmatimonadaceae bacterium]